MLRWRSARTTLDGMARAIRIVAGGVTADAELNDSSTAAAIWAALPLEFNAETWGDEVYASIGLTLAPVLGYDDPVALSHAAELGRAMQLTNILRDIAEDLARGRLYLPLDELRAAGIEESDLEAFIVRVGGEPEEVGADGPELDADPTQGRM